VRYYTGLNISEYVLEGENLLLFTHKGHLVERALFAHPTPANGQSLYLAGHFAVGEVFTPATACFRVAKAGTSPATFDLFRQESVSVRKRSAPYGFRYSTRSLP
jgi:hypothetical protein